MADDATTSGTADFDGLLSMAGDCGRYQLMVFLLAGVMQFVSIDAFSINFLAASVSHSCRVDNVSTHRVSDGAAGSSSTECYLYGDEVETGSAENESSSLVATPCHQWNYDHSQFTATIVSQVPPTVCRSNNETLIQSQR